MPHQKRTAFFVSDSTGITAEALGNSMIAQFDKITWRTKRFPFVDAPARVQALSEAIVGALREDGSLPIVFLTVVNEAVASAIRNNKAYFVDVFGSFINPLEQELAQPSSHTIGKAHRASGGLSQQRKYEARIAALNFALNHDDGASDQQMDDADLILVGVSRSGKTPTSLYLAMQYSLRVANVPLIPEDFERGELPETFRRHKDKMFGLTITPEQLSRIREQRRPNSLYASLENCRREVKSAELMMKREGIAYLESTHRSVEEIATTILDQLKLTGLSMLESDD
jgi:regulator of PEP synthase PpsR (kinase-PPPase family)